MIYYLKEQIIELHKSCVSIDNSFNTININNNINNNNNTNNNKKSSKK